LRAAIGMMPTHGTIGGFMRTLLVVCLLLAGTIVGHAESENELINRANAALNAKDWATAEKVFRQLVTAAPTNWLYFQGLADAVGAQGKYPEAIAGYDKAIALALATKDEKARAAAGAMLTQEGLFYLRQKKFAEGVAAFTKATQYVANQATAWFNVCAAAFNAGDVKAAVAGCDKAIAADPNKADAWFIKGALMVADAKAGPNGKMIPPKGTVEALKKYLALAPNGSHVKDVQEMLTVFQ
jgi:tetratricopeptide (TPR) repeat protein